MNKLITCGGLTVDKVICTETLRRWTKLQEISFQFQLQMWLYTIVIWQACMSFLSNNLRQNSAFWQKVERSNELTGPVHPCSENMFPDLHLRWKLATCVGKTTKANHRWEVKWTCVCVCLLMRDGWSWKRSECFSWEKVFYKAFCYSVLLRGLRGLCQNPLHFIASMKWF